MSRDIRRRRRRIPCFSSNSLVNYTFLLMMMLLVPLDSVQGVSTPPGKRVSCYVCHWSSAYSNRSNYVDTCSPYNFRAETANIVECPGGCEAVGLKKSQGESPFHFYRNCMDLGVIGGPPDKDNNKESGVGGKDRCLTVKTKTHWEDRCECLSNFCNHSTVIHKNSPGLLILISFIVTALFGKSSSVAITR